MRRVRDDAIERRRWEAALRHHGPRPHRASTIVGTAAWLAVGASVGWALAGPWGAVVGYLALGATWAAGAWGH